MRISDWSSDVCSSDLVPAQLGQGLRGIPDQLHLDILPRPTALSATAVAHADLRARGLRQRLADLVGQRLDPVRVVRIERHLGAGIALFAEPRIDLFRSE